MTDTLTPEISFAWTPGLGSYKAYPPYVNLTGNRLTVRGTEQRVKTGVDVGGYWKQGETVSIDLPPEVLDDLRNALAMNVARTIDDAPDALCQYCGCLVSANGNSHALDCVRPTAPDARPDVERLFDIARKCFHYAPRGTPDGNMFEQSEQGRMLMNAVRAIAALQPMREVEAMRETLREARPYVVEATHVSASAHEVVAAIDAALVSKDGE